MRNGETPKELARAIGARLSVFFGDKWILWEIYFNLTIFDHFWDQFATREAPMLSRSIF